MAQRNFHAIKTTKRKHWKRWRKEKKRSSIKTWIHATSNPPGFPSGVLGRHFKVTATSDEPITATGALQGEEHDLFSGPVAAETPWWISAVSCASVREEYCKHEQSVSTLSTRGYERGLCKCKRSVFFSACGGNLAGSFQLFSLYV